MTIGASGSASHGLAIAPDRRIGAFQDVAVWVGIREQIDHSCAQWSLERKVQRDQGHAVRRRRIAQDLGSMRSGEVGQRAIQEIMMRGQD